MAKIFGGLVGFVLIWFGVVRLTSGGRAVRSFGEGEVVTEWGGRLRVGCYNIAHGRGGEPGGSNWEGGTREERQARLAEIGELIREKDLDVVVLNEVDFDCTWSHGVNQAEYLAEECGYGFWVEQRNLDLGLPFFRVAIGNAVLSRFPVKEVGGVEYPAVNWWEPILAGKKGGVKAVVSLPDGSEVEVLGVHAETRDEEVRKESVRELIRVSGERAILAGDFNSVRGGDGTTAVDLVMGDGRWREAKAEGATFPTGDVRVRIDWIFVPRGWEEIGSEVVVRELSDHAMVIGEWRVSGEN